MKYTTTLQQSICLFITLFVLSFAHGQMRHVKTKYGIYANNQQEEKWYVDFLYNSPQQLHYLENKGYIKDSTGQFINNSKTLYTRDNLGRVTEEIGLNWDGSQWLNNYKVLRTYDLLGNTIRFSEFQWEFGNWVELIRDEWIYSSTNQILKYTLLQGFNGILKFHSKYEYEYDVQGRLINEYKFNWNSTNNFWNNPTKSVNVYKNITAVIDSSYHYFWNTNQNQYVLNGRTLYNYNASNQLITELLQNYPNNQWTNNKKIDYQYQSSGLLERRSDFNWVNTAWVLYYESIYENDSQGRLTKRTQKDYDNTAMQAINKFQYTYAFANDSSLLTEKIESWNNNAWVDAAWYEFLFEQTQVSTAISKYATVAPLRAYPNPFHINTVIEFDAPANEEGQISICNLNGQVVFHENRMFYSGKNTLLWDATNDNDEALPAGLYLVTVKTQLGSTHFKLIKQ